MIHFGMQFSHTDICSYLKSIYNFFFFFNEINESCGNYIALAEACFKNGFECLT